jgi:hypothetical protein
VSLAKLAAVAGVGVLLLLAAVRFTGDVSDAAARAPAPARSATIDRGEEGLLLTPTRDDAVVGRSLADLEELRTFAAAKDFRGIAGMALAGRAFFVSPGERVLVIETSVANARVRMLSGPNEGEDGWTAREWVQPAPAQP